jgi:branched-chain amino acid transport system ATP-binding protein
VVSLLEVAALTVRFGGVTAVDGAALSAEAGAITGLVGPKGSGKTTVLDVVTGLRPAAAGTVRLGDHDVTRATPDRRARLGIARTAQVLDLFGSLTVRENVLVAGEIRRGLRSLLRPRRRSTVFADELLERVGIAPYAGERAATVPVGVGRMLQLARALATRPRLLLLDELAAGLDAEQVERLSALLRSLAADGLAVLLVEHEPDLALDVCDLLHVMEFGRVVAAGTPAQILQDQRVRELTR